MTSEQIKALITAHKTGPGVSYQRYQRYYEGNNVTIQSKEIQAEPDNRKSMPFARKAINSVIGYMFGDVTWIYPDENETIKKLNSEEGKLKESNCAEHACTKGLGYKIFWQQDKELRYAVVPPDNIIVKRTDEIEPELEEVYYYTESVTINDKGNTVETTRFWVYTAEKYELYIEIDKGGYILAEEGENPAGVLNVVEHYINPERRNIFYHVIDLIDLMDEIVSSNMANEIQTIANAILVMSGYVDDEIVDEKTGETDRSKFLKSKMKIIENIQKAQGDFVEWLTKNVQWEGIFGIYDRVYNAIWEFLEIPNWTDERYANAPSGRALQLMLLPFENKAKMVERNYKQGLIKEVEIINAFPVTKNSIDPEKLEIEFVRNMPFDEAAKIENAVKIFTMLGAEAAIEYMGENIIPDQEEAIKRIEAQLATEISDIMTAQVRDEPLEGE